MPRVTRSELAAYAVCALLVAVIGWRSLRSGEEATSQPPASRPGRVEVTRSAEAAVSVVHVVGAVRRPGVYRVRAGGRVSAAIAKAGGATPAADLQSVNLAAKVADAQQVVVPRRAQPSAPGDAPAGPATASRGAAPTTQAPVNLNTATVEDLDAVDGIGPATAQKILELRSQRGGFGSVDDLADVPGIGPKRLASIREQVRV